MDDLTRLSTTRPAISEEIQARWQRIIELMARIVAEKTSDLEKSKELLEERLRFEDLVSDLSASFVNVPPERVEDEIGRALDEIRQFFKADHCSLLEVLADSRQTRFVNTTAKEEWRRKRVSVDVVSGHPWGYRQLVEHGEPVIFSSLEALPPEASVDRVAWEQEGVEALLVLPLRVGGQVTHLIGLQSLRVGHEWPVAHIRRLGVLGEVFANALINKRAQEALLKSERTLAEAQRVAHVGSWDWDIRGETHHWSCEFYRILGLLPQAIEATYERFLAFVHPDERQAVHQANQESISDPDKPYSIEFRVVRPDGTERVVHARADVLFDQDRRPLRMIGTFHDITDRKKAEEALQKAFDEINKLKEQLEAENIYLREEIESTDLFRDIGGVSNFKDIIGVSNPIRYVLYRITQVARSSTTVLLTGETGTGKGLFARALHEASDRREKAFVHVNCAGLPANLIESELFGREKGAFTGSTARQIGRFELANGGTIFLDEIGELPLELQAKLLKVIDEGEFERLGSPHPVKVDVRIIASTNRDLEEAIQKGQFRKDLFYRLNVFPITIPPLRQRIECIPLLVKFFADKFSKIHGKPIKRIPANTMKALEKYSWPGNVRELMNVIERAVIVSEGSELQLAEKIDAIPFAHQEETAKVEEKAGAKGLSVVERDHILRIFQETGWKIEGPNGAAQLLAMNPSTLRARMRKLGIKRPRG